MNTAYPMQWISMMMMMMICCGMAVKRMGMFGVVVRNMKALTVQMKTVTLVGKVDRIQHSFCNFQVRHPHCVV